MQETRETWIRFLGQEDPLEWDMEENSSILAWKSHGQRSLTGYSPRGLKELDTIEQLSTWNMIYSLNKNSSDWGFWYFI